MHADGSVRFTGRAPGARSPPRLAEIKEPSNLHTGRFEVIDALHLPRVVQRASTD